MRVLTQSIFRLTAIKRLTTTLFLAANPDDYLIRIYKKMGILNFRSLDASGEKYLFNLLGQYFSGFKKPIKPIIFDVGAHNGETTQCLRKYIPNAKLYAFEPNPAMIPILESIPEVTVTNIGLSDKNEVSMLFVDTQEESQLATLYEKVHPDIHDIHTSNKIRVKISTIDNYCRKHKISRIDLLKIDTEGHELKVLLGTKRLIASYELPLIQLEFNAMNVVSRTFMKDFYDYLADYSFFRLKQNCLIPLKAYSALHEIFQFQNILAVHKFTEQGFFSEQSTHPNYRV